jgi:hypothetical protein
MHVSPLSIETLTVLLNHALPIGINHATVLNDKRVNSNARHHFKLSHLNSLWSVSCV